MQAVLPGEPAAKVQALSAVEWHGKRLIAYISGAAVVILGGPQELIQTLHVDQVDELDSVSIDYRSGKLAASGGGEIFIYAPYGRDEGLLKWRLSGSIRLDEPVDGDLGLSWGTEEQLLASSNTLQLFETARDNKQIWKCRLPTPARSAQFCSDGKLIASFGAHDRLVKVWRRQSFDSEDTWFDFTYLPHPTSVTHCQWRNVSKHQHSYYESNIHHVLFSICADYKVRIWAASDPHGARNLTLWAEIDMAQAIQTRDLEGPAPPLERYAFFINADDFAAAASSALESAASNSENENPFMNHLAEIADAYPDVCAIVDRAGKLSAWGLENIGNKAKRATDVFNVAHVDDVHLFPDTKQGDSSHNATFHAFFDYKTSKIVVILHSFDGTIAWHEGSLHSLLDPLLKESRQQLRAVWTGPNGTLRAIEPDSTGVAFLSQSNKREILVWKQDFDGSSMFLHRTTRLCARNIVLSCVLLEKGHFVITLHRDDICIWDTGSSEALEIACHELSSSPSPNTLVLLEEYHGPGGVRLAAVSDSLDGIVLEVTLPVNVETDGVNPGLKRCTIDVYSFETELGNEAHLTHIDAISCTGSDRRKNGNLIYSRDSRGIVRIWRASLKEKPPALNWYNISRFEYLTPESYKMACSADQKLAITVNAPNHLVIWDLRSSQLEYEHSFGDLEEIADLNWMYRPGSVSLLAVALPRKVVVLVQVQFAYSTMDQPWVIAQEYSLKDYSSYPINRIAWLAHENLAINAGNQIFGGEQSVRLDADALPSDHTSSQEACKVGLSELTVYYSASLPVYHPEFLEQLILLNRWKVAMRILTSLYEALKYHSDGDYMDPFLGLSFEDLIDEASHSDASDEADEEKSFGENIAISLKERLGLAKVPNLNGKTQQHLAFVIERAAVADKFHGSLDENAMRYLFSALRGQDDKVIVQRLENGLCWRDYTFALHSSTQDAAIDIVSRQYNGKMGWIDARNSGIFMWTSSLETLRFQFENVARNEYGKSESRDPTNCSLYYLALRKKTVLIGLWRMATGNREQASTRRLLSQDFSESRWQTAALKNAYALLGKRRYEYAAAWFLLADHLQDAVNVCVNQIGDWQLGIAIARVYQGDDDNPVLSSLLRDNVLQKAVSDGNRWLATWVFSMLGQHSLALRALMDPLAYLVPQTHSTNLQANSYLRNEPALVVHYRQLRHKLAKDPKSSLSVSQDAEQRFVIRSAMQYNRMGCDMHALYLLRNWRFQKSARSPKPDKVIMNGDQTHELKPFTESPPEKKKKEKPTNFVEPTANDLLDSFGF